MGDIATFAYGKMPKSNVLTEGAYPTYSGYKYQYKYPEYNCEKGDVIVVARGVGGTGDVKIVKKRCYLTNLSIKITLDATIADNKYFYYNYLNSNLRHLDSGSAQSQITKNDLNRVPISLPSLPEQKAIAQILGSLDDKIELNRRMNATLEGIAQALFKSWFVDFDPVIDNALAAGNPIPEEFAERAQLRSQALAKGTANREAAKNFPDAFQLTEEMGWIPEGWEVDKIEDLAERIAMGPFGSSIKVSTFVKEGVPIISGQHLKNTLLEDSDYNYVTPEHAKKLERSNVFPGDIIFTHAGSIGQVALIPPDAKFRRYVISQRQLYLRCDKKKTSSIYLTYFFRSHYWQHIILANASQVGVPSLARPSSYLKSIEVINPPITIIDHFDEFGRNIIASIGSNNLESKCLTKLRDTLLPKLISGELRVPDAEKLVKEIIL